MKSSGWARDGGQASQDKNSHRFAKQIQSWLRTEKKQVSRLRSATSCQGGRPGEMRPSWIPSGAPAVQFHPRMILLKFYFSILCTNLTLSRSARAFTCKCPCKCPCKWSAKMVPGATCSGQADQSIQLGRLLEHFWEDCKTGYRWSKKEGLGWVCWCAKEWFLPYHGGSSGYQQVSNLSGYEFLRLELESRLHRLNNGKGRKDI